MQEIRRRREVALLGVRAHVPLVMRVLALAAGVAAVFLIVYNVRHTRREKEFVLRKGKAELSTHVTGRVENYERRVEEGGRTTMLVRAAVATDFEDGHHELTQAHIEQYPKPNEPGNKIDAREALYFSETETVVFNGNVQIETGDRLHVNSESVNYDVKKQTGDSPGALTFSRDNVSGKADAATINGQEKHLELRGNVEITVAPAPKGEAAKKDQGAKSPLGVGVGGQPVTIRAQHGDFDQFKNQLAFTGGATAEQGPDLMSGDSITGFMNDKRQVQRIETRGSSYLRSNEPGRAAEVRSVNMDFFFVDAKQQLEHGVASQNVQARTLEADSEATLTTPADAQVFFDTQTDKSLLKEMRAEGRPVVTMSAPKSRAGDPKAANKRLTANSVHLTWRVTGKDLERAEAVGDAELVIEPVQQSPQADRQVLTAPRFDGDFFEQGNLAKQFKASGGSKTVITPLVQTEKRGVRTMTAETTVVLFTRETQHAERVDAQGDAKFNEGDRNGQAQNVTYTASDTTVRLRGGEPVAWDSRARIKAVEIDTNTTTKITYARQHVETTYYNQEQTGGATPFEKVKSPVFVTSNEAEFRHDEGLGIYTGDARAWQDDNFLRSDRITMRRDSRRMEGEGHVQSALYRARRKDAGGNSAVVPVFATSTRMFYSDADRVLHYEGGVDIKQGTERITSEVADVYLKKDQAEVDHTVAQRNVVVTQPGKKGTGDWAQYTAADDTVVLTGTPARVVDPEQGTTEGRRMTVYLSENRVVSDSAPTSAGQPAGRVHTVHKINKKP